MKKIEILLLFVIIIFISIINVNAEGVSIKNIDLVDSSGNAAEISEPKINGLNIGFDLAFKDVGDTAKYEVVLNNPTNREYEINTDTKFSSSNYISYTYELKDKSNRIKANSEVVLYITIKYENAVPNTSLVDGKYIENNNMGISLLTEDNPNTFNNILWLLLILIVLFGITLIYIASKKKLLLAVLIGLLLVPVSIFALEKLKLTVSTKIMVGETYNVYYGIGNAIRNTDLGKENILAINCLPMKIELSDGISEDYSLCYNVYKKDNIKHFEGEKVSISSLEIISVISDNCILDEDNMIMNCPRDSFYNDVHEHFYYGCTDNVEHFVPVFGVSQSYPNKCTEDEFNKMNFKNLINADWDVDSGKVEFTAPSTFVMPNHDVYIDYYITSSS